jgi:hypothetical protein
MQPDRCVHADAFTSILADVTLVRDGLELREQPLDTHLSWSRAEFNGEFGSRLPRAFCRKSKS